MMVYPTIAFVSGGGGPVAIPVMLIIGWYFLENEIARYACLVLALLWFIFITLHAIFTQNLVLLLFPALVLFVWGIISEIMQSFKSKYRF